MEISKAGEGVFERGDEARFTGEVWLRGTLTVQDGTNIGIVHFSPGGRTRWREEPLDGARDHQHGDDALERRLVGGRATALRPPEAHGLVARSLEEQVAPLARQVLPPLVELDLERLRQGLEGT